MNRWRRLIVGAGALSLGAGVLGGLGEITATAAYASPCTAQTCTQTFSFAGNTTQTFTVPAGVTEVSISAAGAQGGGYPGAYGGGNGAELQANFSVVSGETLHVVVGGEGSSAINAGGGGGGSFVYTGSQSDPDLFIAAAGGGGGDGGGAGSEGNASSTAAAGSSNLGTGGAPGTSGGGGLGGGGLSAGGGGGGLSGDGGSASSGGAGGYSLETGAGGGAGTYSSQNGGFGGGGAAGAEGAGGGGGYNGGGGGGGIAENTGGGGGSFSSGTLTGSSSGANSGNGVVKISYGLLCGQDVTSNLTLSGNLNCSSDTNMDALIVDSSSVTINLAGFTISGPGGSHDTYGIYSEDHNNVTVEGGTIKNFNRDIEVDGGANLALSSVKLLLDGKQNYTGFAGQDLTGGKVTSLYSTNAWRGTDVSFSASVTIKNSLVTNSATGFHEYTSSGDTYNADNAQSSSDDGFSAWYSSNETYSSNTAHAFFDNGFEIKNYGNGPATIENNTAGDDTCILICISGGAGFYLYQNYSTTTSVTETVTGNTENNASVGIWDTESYGALISHNTTSNDDDGILVDYPRAYTVTYNTAKNNTYGIYAINNGSGDNLAAGSFNTASADSTSDLYAVNPVPGTQNHATNCHNWVCVP